jgi:GH15 family glucan-1,4-alpha-glucosidase
MQRVCLALGIKDCAILEEYKHKFSGNPSFSEIYSIVNRMPEKDQARIARAGQETQQFVDIKEHYRMYVTDTIFSAYVSAMTVLKERKATKDRAEFLTEAVDKMYDSIMDEWPQVKRAVGSDATLLHRLLHLASSKWTEEILCLAK